MISMQSVWVHLIWIHYFIAATLCLWYLTMFYDINAICLSTFDINTLLYCCNSLSLILNNILQFQCILFEYIWYEYITLLQQHCLWFLIMFYDFNAFCLNTFDMNTLLYCCNTLSLILNNVLWFQCNLFEYIWYEYITLLQQHLVFDS